MIYLAPSAVALVSTAGAGAGAGVLRARGTRRVKVRMREEMARERRAIAGVVREMWFGLMDQRV